MWSRILRYRIFWLLPSFLINIQSHELEQAKGRRLPCYAQIPLSAQNVVWLRGLEYIVNCLDISLNSWSLSAVLTPTQSELLTVAVNESSTRFTSRFVKINVKRKKPISISFLVNPLQSIRGECEFSLRKVPVCSLLVHVCCWPFIWTEKKELCWSSPIESKTRMPRIVVLETFGRVSKSASSISVDSSSSTEISASFNWLSHWCSSWYSSSSSSSSQFAAVLLFWGVLHLDLVKFMYARWLTLSNEIISSLGWRKENSQPASTWPARRYALKTISSIVESVIVAVIDGDESFVLLCWDSLWCLGNTRLLLLTLEAHLMLCRTVSFSARVRNSCTEKLTTDENGPDIDLPRERYFHTFVSQIMIFAKLLRTFCAQQRVSKGTWDYVCSVRARKEQAWWWRRFVEDSLRHGDWRVTWILFQTGR